MKTHNDPDDEDPVTLAYVALCEAQGISLDQRPEAKAIGATNGWGYNFQGHNKSYGYRSKYAAARTAYIFCVPVEKK